MRREFTMNQKKEGYAPMEKSANHIDVTSRRISLQPYRLEEETIKL
jgi:hypothetical protein